MRTATRLRIERESRRGLILEAARRLFASRGVDRTTMEGVAAEAGYTRRTLYAYFRSREEVLLEVLSEDLRSRWDLQKEAVARGATGLEKLRIWAEILHAVSRDNPQTLQLQVYLDFKGITRKRVRPALFRDFESINTELAEGLRKIFRRGIADGSLRRDLDLDLCISSFLYSYRAVLHRALFPAYSLATFDPGQYVANYLDLFCRAIRNEEKQP